MKINKWAIYFPILLSSNKILHIHLEYTFISFLCYFYHTYRFLLYIFHFISFKIHIPKKLLGFLVFMQKTGELPLLFLVYFSSNNGIFLAWSPKAVCVKVVINCCTANVGVKRPSTTASSIPAWQATISGDR